MIIVPPVNFISTAAGGGLLLDGFSPTLALSTRKVLTAYAGSCLRVRRTSDDTEQDIGFSGSALDTSALTTFCSGTDGYVVTWYDQSGNTRDVTQATAGLQLQIVSGGALINTVNSNPTITFGTGQLVSAFNRNDIIDNTAAYTLFGSLRLLTGNGTGSVSALNPALIEDQDGDWGSPFSDDVFGHYQYDGATKIVENSVTAPVTGTTLTRWDKVNLKGYLDGGTAASTASSSSITGPGTNLVNVGNRYDNNSSGRLKAYVMEIFVFNTELSAANSNTIGAGVATYNGATWSNIS